jgi:hypothetical protein
MRFQHSNPTPAGLAENTINFSVYPNPANDYINIESDGKVNISIIDAMGKTYLEKILISEKEQIEISHLNAGVYFIKVDNQFSFRFIKN